MAVATEIQVSTLLGGRKVLGAVREPADFVQALRTGLPYAALEALAEVLQADLGAVGAVVGITTRTLARRKHEQLLSPIESDRLYRIAHITQFAATTLGSVDKAQLWLKRENRALGGATPLSLLDTELGQRQVEEALLHLSHGIYA